MIKAIHKQEGGQILILLILVIFAFCGLMMVPLLNFMSSGANIIKDKALHTQEIYAAEAGVRDAIWKIQRVVPGLPKQQSDPALQYVIAGNVNGKQVNVTVAWNSSDTYQICSLATDPNTGHQSTIDSEIKIGSTGGLDLSAFTTNALTSPGTITTKTSDAIYGNVWAPSGIDNPGVLKSGTLNTSQVTGWPTAQKLDEYFSNQVDKSSPYSSGAINVSQPGQSGPLYATNGNCTMTGTGNLTGVIYVVGNLSLDNSASINLCGWTIFITGSFSSSPQSYVSGPGAIIAQGSINFQPNVSPNYIFVMSVSGQVNLQPGGNFVGAVAGDTNVNLQPNCTLIWQNPGVGNLDLPGLYNTVSEIKTWNIH